MARLIKSISQRACGLLQCQYVPIVGIEFPHTSPHLARAIGSDKQLEAHRHQLRMLRSSALHMLEYAPVHRQGAEPEIFSHRLLLPGQFPPSLLGFILFGP